MRLSPFFNSEPDTRPEPDTHPAEVIHPLAEELEKLQVSHQELLKNFDEKHDQLLRLAADFDNARKRWEREKQDTRQYAVTEFARDLLPVIDAFDKASLSIEQAGITSDTEEGRKMAAIIEGVQMVSRLFADTLAKHSIQRLPGKGEAFNPAWHNAVAKVVDPSLNQETILDEYIPGYKIADRVLRTAMVRVASPD